MSESNHMLSQYQLVELLQNGVATVTFQKIDGTLREMRCTLQPHLLPPSKQLLQENVQATTERSSLAVWDLDQQAWRSFRFDSVQRVVKVVPV